MKDESASPPPPRKPPKSKAKGPKNSGGSARAGSSGNASSKKPGGSPSKKPGTPSKRGTSGRRHQARRDASTGRWLSRRVIALTGGRWEYMNPNEQIRFVNLGMLMIFTTALAIGSATALAAMATHRSMLAMLPVGLFFGGFVFFIDRSVTSYVPNYRNVRFVTKKSAKTVKAPLGEVKLPSETTLEVKKDPPGHGWGVIGPRIAIAVVASLLVSEIVLTYIFQDLIGQQLDNDHGAQITTAQERLDREYKGRVQPFQREIDKAKKYEGKVADDYAARERQANCQLQGSCGLAGAGPLFTEAKNSLDALRQQKKQAHDAVVKAEEKNQPEIDRLNAERDRRKTKVVSDTGAVKGLLAKEEAFWSLTKSSGVVLFFRVMLALLLLAIDLSPIIYKLSHKAEVHDQRVRDENLRDRIRSFWENLGDDTPGGGPGGGPPDPATALKEQMQTQRTILAYLHRQALTRLRQRAEEKMLRLKLRQQYEAQQRRATGKQATVSDLNARRKKHGA
ncbi:DUF4407 domain-containing protein [Actinomadura syzygii]|uniref:DUF4407 domain-containing protein n=2 Tax=Actinomadura syzygii TaxID=1427538 RepID=A0A5D0TY21_9ACTN|nr:DUF4407 domain-containing protein [Actinomadura syzygii]